MTSSDDVRLGVVILTLGDRADELDALLDSIATQKGGTVPTVVVAQGTALDTVTDWVTTLEIPKNVGIPSGRNIGISWLTQDHDIDVIVILDDDGLLPDPETFDLIRTAFHFNPKLGVAGFRIADENGVSHRRHIPRLFGRGPMRRSMVTTFPGGGHAISMKAFADAGPLPAKFFYAHEETDFAWRVLDAGWDVEYRPDMLLQHPRTDPSRHDVYYRFTARNRVWLAKRRLPWLLVVPYLFSWAAVTMLRRPPLAAAAAWWAGFWEGLVQPCPPRQAMRWATVWRMTKLGRPPVL